MTLFQVIIKAFLHSIPRILQAVIVFALIWLPFAILGVQLFGGRFHKCLDVDGNKINSTIVPSRHECLMLAPDHNFSWQNSQVNFDNVPSAYLALLQVVCQYFYNWFIFLVNYATPDPSVSWGMICTER